jgi:hypothetical protein
MVTEGMKIMKYITNVSVMLALGVLAVTGALSYMAMENAFAAVADNQSASVNTTQTCTGGAQCHSESQSSPNNNINGNGLNMH